MRFAAEDVNNNTSILPNTHIEVESVYLPNVPDVVPAMIEIANNTTLILGNEKSAVAEFTGVVGKVYDIAQLSATAIGSSLSDISKYPFFSRVTASGDYHMFAMQDCISYYSSIGGAGWDGIAIITHTDGYGISLAETFTTTNTLFEILSYQQFLLGSFSFDIEFGEIKNSGARVILAFLYSTTWDEFIVTANDFGLVGDNYVWFASASLVGSPVFSQHPENVLQLSRGVIGIFDYIPHSGPVYDDFEARWLKLDPNEYPGAGVIPTDFTLFQYDTLLVAALAAHDIDSRNELDQQRIPAQTWFDAIRNVEVEGVTGSISFDEKGDRTGTFSFSYYDPEAKKWQLSSLWSEKEGFQLINDVIWYSNTTNIPDLDIREPFDYWSCHDGEERTDPTGKSVILHTPDRSDIDEIASGYHCDHFIDCKNFSDESEDCADNFKILFIVFGVIDGLLLLLSVFLLLFVVIFGLIFKYQRLRAASPFFLIILLFSIIVGLSSVYAWFGKPHPVSCVFQLWLLGLSSVSMITVLCTKTWRIWRIFRSALTRHKITDFELLGLWLLIMFPAVIIITLWTIIATPTAAIVEQNGEDHYVCTTGGFIGDYGGYIFFGILLAYGCIILFVGVFLSTVTRNVPSLFNESKLLAISIYNLGFLSAVIIPVYLVVQPFNPFVAWILRTIAILYAFCVTLLIQFIPPLFEIVFVNRLRNKTVTSYIMSSDHRTHSRGTQNSHSTTNF